MDKVWKVNYHGKALYITFTEDALVSLATFYKNPLLSIQEVTVPDLVLLRDVIDKIIKEQEEVKKWS